MKTNFINGKINIEISDIEKKELEIIKETLLKELNNYTEIEREEIDLSLSTHILNEYKLSELNNLRHHIIIDLDYNNSFKNVIYFNDYGFIEFVENNLFLHFASAYNILYDTDRAMRVLKNILRVQIIDRMIEFDFKKGVNDPIIFNNKTYNTDHLTVFTPYGFELFEYIKERFHDNRKMFKYSEIYLFMIKEKFKTKCGSMHKNETKYLKFLKEKYSIKVSRLNGSDLKNNILERLKKDFSKEYDIDLS